MVRIIWLDEIVDKLERKHQVARSEVVEVFSNKPHIRFVAKGNRKGEDLYKALGQTDAGRHLIVFYIKKQGGRVLIISARDMESDERKLYDKR